MFLANRDRMARYFRLFLRARQGHYIETSSLHGSFTHTVKEVPNKHPMIFYNS